MSAGAETVGVDIDPQSNSARIEIEIENLFDQNGELKLWESDEGWTGFAIEDGDYYAVDTRRPIDDWTREFRCSERAIRLSIKRHIENPDAGGSGVFERGVRA